MYILHLGLFLQGQEKGQTVIYDACHEKIDPFEVQNIVNFWVFTLL